MTGKVNKERFYKKNLSLILVESVLTYIGPGFSVSIMTIFWNSVGMDQTAIGLVQMLFTVALVLFDIPMGYLADRFSRKAVNIIGDFGCALSFVFYAFSKNMLMVLIAEIALGLSIAMTNGVDQSFIKYYSDKLDPTGKKFEKLNVRVHTIRFLAVLISAVIGGFIAKWSLTFCIGLSFIPYFIGGILAVMIKDFDEKLEQKSTNLLKDLWLNVKDIFKNKKTRILLGTGVVSSEITHPQIWVFTPLLILVGVPIEIVSIGWVINYLMQYVGSKISEKTIHWSLLKKFEIPMIVQFLWMIVLIINVNIVTVWFFAFNGLVHGMMRGPMETALQKTVSKEKQTSVMSIASTAKRLFYIPLVYIINCLGNIEYTYALLGTILVFLPLCIILDVKLRKMQQEEQA